MPFQDCPHCYNRVIPNASGECPACRKNVNDWSDADPNLVLARIEANEALPSTCAICGIRTERFVYVEAEAAFKNENFGEESSGTSPLLSLLLFLIFLPLGWIVFRLGFASEDSIRFHHTTLAVSLPVCEGCRKSERTKPTRANGESFTMTFLVHRAFHEALQQYRTQSAT